MDYKLPALKMFVAQLQQHARPAPHRDGAPPAMALGSLPFQRVWLQGVLVAGGEQGHTLLDDGSGVIELLVTKEFLELQLKSGMYVLVVGAYSFNSAGIPIIKVHKVVDLSFSPDREAMWNLEVIEAYQLFYASAVSQ